MFNSSVCLRSLALAATVMFGFSLYLAAGKPESQAMSEKDLRKLAKGIVFENQSGQAIKIQLLTWKAGTTGTVELYLLDSKTGKLVGPTILKEQQAYSISAHTDGLVAPVPSKTLITTRPKFDRRFLLMQGQAGKWTFEMTRIGGSAGDDKQPELWFLDKTSAKVAPPAGASLVKDEGGLSLVVEGPLAD